MSSLYTGFPIKSGITDPKLNVQACLRLHSRLQRNGTLYIGVTSNLIARISQHKNHEVEGFTKRYNVTQLMWYETHDTIEQAILREKQLKNGTEHGN